MSNTPNDRAAIVQRMAADLVRFDAISPETESILALHGARYSMVDIVLHISDARQVAFQIVEAAAAMEDRR